MPTNNVITLGLVRIMAGEAAPSGTMPGSLTDIGYITNDSCKLSQDAPEVTELFAEGYSAPVYKNKEPKMPKLTFSLLGPAAATMAEYLGGEVSEDGVWSFKGDEIVANKAFKVITKVGYNIEIPNADIEAVLTGDLSGTDALKIDVTVTPLSVTTGGALRMVPKAAAE